MTAILVPLCIAYVDRPVASYVDEHLRHRALFNVTYDLLKPIPVIAVLGLMLMFVHGLRVAAGQRAAPWTGTAIACAWAVAWGLATTVVLKRIFGRADVYPAWTLDHRYFFHPFYGSFGNEAFPSGTMTVGVSALGLLWIRRPALRPVWAAIAIFLIFALIVTNSHWVADIIAGTFLGATIGWLTDTLLPDGSRRMAAP